LLTQNYDRQERNVIGTAIREKQKTDSEILVKPSPKEQKTVKGRVIPRGETKGTLPADAKKVTIGTEGLLDSGKRVHAGTT